MSTYQVNQVSKVYHKRVGASNWVILYLYMCHNTARYYKHILIQFSISLLRYPASDRPRPNNATTLSPLGLQVDAEGGRPSV